MRKAQKKKLNVISCSYDTFEAVSMLNRAVYDRLKEKELIYVGDIMVRDVFYLPSEAVLDDWHK